MWIGIAVFVIIVGIIVYYYLTIFVFNKKKIKSATGKLSKLDLSKRLESNQLSTEEKWDLARSCQNDREYPKAASILSKLIQDKQYPPAIGEDVVKIEYAKILYELEEDKQALEVLLDLFQQEPDQPDVCYHIAGISAGQLLHQQASVFIRRCLLLDQNGTQNFRLAAIIYASLEEYPQAKSSLERFLFLKEESDFEMTYCLGVIEFLLKSFKKAYTIFHELSQKTLPFPLFYQVIRGMGFAMLEDQHLDRSLEYFSQALDKVKATDQESFSLQSNQDLVCISILSKKYDIAITFAERGLSIPEEQRKQLISFLKFKVNPQNPPSDFTEDAIENWIQDWKEVAINKHVVLDTMGFKQRKKASIQEILNPKIVSIAQSKPSLSTIAKNSFPLVAELIHFPKDQFLVVARKVIDKLGLVVREEIYHETDGMFSDGDGVDFLCESNAKRNETYMVQFRRWDTDSIGDFVLRNLEDSVSMYNLKKGLFITTGDLSTDAVNYSEKSELINVIAKKQLDFLLNGLVEPKKKGLF